MLEKGMSSSSCRYCSAQLYFNKQELVHNHCIVPCHYSYSYCPVTAEPADALHKADTVDGMLMLSRMN